MVPSASASGPASQPSSPSPQPSSPSSQPSSQAPQASSLIHPTRDRRHTRRARLGVPVTITVAGKLLDALGADLSPGGIRILASATDPSARAGDAVSLVFFLDGDLVSARGTVRWCATTRNGLATFGVGFTSLEDDGPSLVASHCGASLC